MKARQKVNRYCAGAFIGMIGIVLLDIAYPDWTGLIDLISGVGIGICGVGLRDWIEDLVKEKNK